MLTRSAQAPDSPPTVVISLDLELAWGSFDHAFGPTLVDMARWTHDHGAPLLLEQLTRNGLSATWAIVGAAMLDRLPDLPEMAPLYTRRGKEWFSFVPAGATEDTAPEWFGASFLRDLKEARPAQEIGFHGFSHVELGDPGLPVERARQELERCAELAAWLEIDAPSFVFPRNGVGHLELLSASGVRAFRGPTQDPVRLRSRWMRRMWLTGADVLGLRPALVRPRLEGGMVDIPGSLMVRHAGGWRGIIPDASRLRRLRKGLELVQERGGVFHVWLHPENLYFGRPRIEKVLAAFHAELADLVAASRVRVLTMGEVARELLAGRSQAAPGRPAGAHRPRAPRN